MFKEYSLENQVAIVTGAGKGIGKAIALCLAEAGANIVVVARTKTEIERVSEEIKSMGRDSFAVCADVTDSKEVDRMVFQALENFGKIDILVNNAGQFNKSPIVPLPDVKLAPPVVPKEVNGRITDEEWKNLFEVNVHGVFYCCRSVASHMLKRKKGKIINIGSNSGIQASPYVSSYNCTKAAIGMLTRVAALEWAPYGICVNAIAPGEFHTSLTDFSWSDPKEKKLRLERIPMHREGSLRQLGILAAYMASAAADYMTGQIVYMDGGLTAR